MHATNKSFNFGHYVPNDQVLNKKVPGNPRYQHVKPAVNTGSSVKKQIADLREKQKNCQQKKDEVFKRISFSNFIGLLLNCTKEKVRLAKANGINAIEDPESSGDKKPDSLLPNVIMGIGEIDLANRKKKPNPSPSKIEKDFPYLLLDVREKEKFMQCHIKTAKHYPSAFLARSIGFETEEMKLYKNNAPELIILYDDDESISVRVATTLVQRGYDNVYVLTGGLKYCCEVFPKNPLSHLCTSQRPESSLSSSPNVIAKDDCSEFSQEDIDIIEQYVGFPKNGYSICYSLENNTQNVRSGSSRSRNQKLGHYKVNDVQGMKPNVNTLTYRRNSDDSLKSSEQTRTKLIKSASDSRSKSGKKAPWK